MSLARVTVTRVANRRYSDTMWRALVREMMKSGFLRVLFAIVGIGALGWLPHTAFAQHGGRGGGVGFHSGGGGTFRGGATGGFHGGGGGRYGYSGGHSYVGYRGGGYYGGHRGYGWHGAYWGYPHYGYGWGLSFGFGWPYWGWGTPYGYGYSPWNYVPYPYYPYYCRPGYACLPHGNSDPPPATARPKFRHTPAHPSRPEEKSTPDTEDGSSKDAAMSQGSVLSSDRIRVMPGNYDRVAHFTTLGNTAVRHEVQSAMRALREMPQFARKREIETGRYSHFSPEERELLRSIN